MVKMVAGARGRSIPGEYRLPLLDEGFDAFLRIPRFRDRGQRLRLLLQLAFERSILGLAEQPFDRPISLRRTHCELARHTCGHCLYIAVRNDEIDEAK